MSTSASWPTWHLRCPRRRRRNWSCGAPGRSRGRTLLPRRRIEGPAAVAERAWLLAGPGAARPRWRRSLPGTASARVVSRPGVGRLAGSPGRRPALFGAPVRAAEWRLARMGSHQRQLRAPPGPAARPRGHRRARRVPDPAGPGLRPGDHRADCRRSRRRLGARCRVVGICQGRHQGPAGWDMASATAEVRPGIA